MTYVYSVSSDTLNGLADGSRLSEEISESSIVVILESIEISGDDLNITFKAALSANDKTILDSVVESHSGEPKEDDVPQLVKAYKQEYDANGNMVSRSVPQKTQEITYARATHDFCNKCTWYSDSVRVVDEVLTLRSGNTYEASSDRFIDVINGVINRQDLHQQYTIEVKVADVIQTSGYTIDHENAEITFDSPPAGAVKCSYSYPTTSKWRLPAPSGKMLVIEHSEVQFTDDVIVDSPLRFVVWVDNPFVSVEGHPLFGIARIPGETVQYNSIKDIINESNTGFTVPPMPEIGKSVIIFPFNYVGEKVMSSQMNAELVIDSLNDVELTGSYGTATFYLIEREI